MIELWMATLTRLLDLMLHPPPEGLKASFFDVAVAFLAHSGITADTVAEAKDALVDLHADLARQIAEVTAEENAEPTYTPPKAPEKPKSDAVVVPLHRHFEPRPPRS